MVPRSPHPRRTFRRLILQSYAAFLQNASVWCVAYPGFHPGLVCRATLGHSEDPPNQLTLLNPSGKRDRGWPSDVEGFSLAVNDPPYSVVGQCVAACHRPVGRLGLPRGRPLPLQRPGRIHHSAHTLAHGIYQPLGGHPSRWHRDLGCRPNRRGGVRYVGPAPLPRCHRARGRDGPGHERGAAGCPGQRHAHPPLPERYAEILPGSPGPETRPIGTAGEDRHSPARLVLASQ